MKNLSRAVWEEFNLFLHQGIPEPVYVRVHTNVSNRWAYFQEFLDVFESSAHRVFAMGL